MKIATWNVNGIRARQAEVRDWIAAERPDVVCLQEIKATPEQIPPELCALDGYWCYWHGGAKGYSGVGLHVAQGVRAERRRCFRTRRSITRRASSPPRSPRRRAARAAR